MEVSLSPRGIVAHLPATAGSTGCVDRSGLRHRRAAPFAAPPRGGLYLSHRVFYCQGASGAFNTPYTYLHKKRFFW